MPAPEEPILPILRQTGLTFRQFTRHIGGIAPELTVCEPASFFALIAQKVRSNELQRSFRSAAKM
jgi:hypothetical protein